MSNLKDKVKDAYGERELHKLEKDMGKYSSFQNKYTLKVNQEEEWYYMTLARVKEMKDKSTLEILQVLLLNVQYHPEIKRRMKKQIKELKKKTYNKTIGNCLYEIMQSYVLKEGDATQNSVLTKTEEHYNRNENSTTRTELADEAKNDEVQINDVKHPVKKKQRLTKPESLKRAKKNKLEKDVIVAENEDICRGSVR